MGGNDGRLDISINNYNWAENIMLALDRSQIGWDSNGYDINSTNAPDFNTDTITLDYVIRKSPDNQAYMGTCTATVNGVTYEGRWQTTANDNNWGKPTAVWSEPFVYFGMSRGATDAQKQVDVMVDSLSAAYSPVSDPVILAPENLGSTLGNLEVTIDWDNYGEETGFNVYRSETNGGCYILIGSAASNETSYTDTGLTWQCSLQRNVIYGYRIDRLEVILLQGFRSICRGRKHPVSPHCCPCAGSYAPS